MAKATLAGKPLKPGAKKAYTAAKLELAKKVPAGLSGAAADKWLEDTANASRNRRRSIQTGIGKLVLENR